MSAHVCAPRSWRYRAVLPCPTCGRRRRFVVAMFEWYPSIFTCCACGDRWSEGGRMVRPFARGWRARARRQARSAWQTAVTRREATAGLFSAIEGGEQ